LVRNILLTALFVSTLVPASAFAQDAPVATGVAFPGSFWIAASNVGPSEPDNVVTQTSFEQGVVVWRKASWFVVPFAGASLTRDTEGYSWNDKHPATAGVKLTKRVPGGVLSAGGGVMFERDPAGHGDRHPSAFAQYWVGWTGDARAQLGTRFVRYPGHASIDSGIVTGRDPKNWITAMTIQQGVAISRWRGIAPIVFTGATGTFDTKQRPWENRLHYEGGVKLARNFVGGVVEAGVAQRQQHRFVANTTESGPVAFVNMWVGWDPRRF
jgi:hypothetical protein